MVGGGKDVGGGWEEGEEGSKVPGGISGRCGPQALMSGRSGLGRQGSFMEGDAWADS